MVKPCKLALELLLAYLLKRSEKGACGKRAREPYCQRR